MYTTNFSVFNRTYDSVQTCSLKLLRLLIDLGGFFHQARASSEHRDYINEVINFSSVERSAYMKERFTMSCLKANTDRSRPSSAAQFLSPCYTIFIALLQSMINTR